MRQHGYHRLLLYPGGRFASVEEAKMVTPFSPVIFAMGGQGTPWQEALGHFVHTKELLRGQYNTSVEDCKDVLARPPTPWSLAVTYFHVVTSEARAEGIAVDPHVAMAGILNAVRVRNRTLAAHIMRLDGDELGRVAGSSRALALLHASRLQWARALSAVRTDPRLVKDGKVMTALFKCVGKMRGWEASLQLLEWWGQKHRVLERRSALLHGAWGPATAEVFPFAASHVLNTMSRQGAWVAAMAMMARVVATGAQPSAHNYAAVLYHGLRHDNDAWCAALGAMAAAAEQENGVTETLLRGSPLSALWDAIHRMQFPCTPGTKGGGDLPALPTPAALYAAVGPLVTTASVAICKKDSQRTPVFTKAADKLVDEARRLGDIVLVLDTNFYAWLLAGGKKGAPREWGDVLTEIRVQHPHLTGKPLRYVVVPFTVHREFLSLVRNKTAASVKRKALLQKRMRFFARSKNFRLLSPASEFYTSVFAPVFRLYAERLCASEGRRADDAEDSANPLLKAISALDDVDNPDRRVMTVCLALQCHALGLDAAAKKQADRVSTAFKQRSFFSKHSHRANLLLGSLGRGDPSLPVPPLVGRGGSDVLLCTFDRELRTAASAVGVPTFPRLTMAGKEEDSRPAGGGGAPPTSE